MARPERMLKRIAEALSLSDVEWVHKDPDIALKLAKIAMGAMNTVLEEDETVITDGKIAPAMLKNCFTAILVRGKDDPDQVLAVNFKYTERGVLSPYYIVAHAPRYEGDISAKIFYELHLAIGFWNTLCQ